MYEGSKEMHACAIQARIHTINKQKYMSIKEHYYFTK